MTNLERLGQEIAREQDALPTRAEERAWVRARLLAGGERRVRRRSRVLALLAAAAASAAAISLLIWATRARPLTVAVGQSGLSAAAGAWLHAPESGPLPLVFSDGTRVEMSARSRAKLLALTPHDTRLLLESGNARVEVAHRPGQNFSIVTGPFTVRVTGTRFELGWNPERDRFELALSEGQVELSGCVFGGGRQLAAGQRVEASCREQRMEVSYSASSAARLDAAATPHVGASGTSSESIGAAARPAGADTPDVVPARPAQNGVRSVWLQLAREGSYAEAFAAADAQGFEAECQRGSAAELSLLAEAARHAGRLAKARSAFTILRRRFPAAKEAGLAAFSLGLLEFDGFGAYAKAAGWFKVYLKERPGGPLTREARGRTMEAVHRMGNRAEARDLALTYLLDYPAGPHAELARRIIASP